MYPLRILSVDAFLLSFWDSAKVRMYPTADNVVHNLRSQLPDIPFLCVWFIDAGTVQMNKTCGDE